MKNTIKKVAFSISAFALLFLPLGINAAPGDIVDTAIKTDDLSTLVELVSAAGLVSALQEPNGPYTVFAPTNAAFEKLPRIVNKAIERDPELLKKILLYHVVGSEIASGDIPRFTRVETLQGSDVFARNNKGKVRINRAKVVIPDVVTTNGTVHVIDRVLIPWREVAKSLRMSSR